MQPIAADDPSECPDCMTYLGQHPMLIEACASVGIEHGRSTQAMLRSYMLAFHRRGHQEDRV